MTKAEVTEKIVNAKRSKNLTGAQIAAGVGLSEFFTISACLGQNTLTRDEVEKSFCPSWIAPYLQAYLCEPANKGEGAPTVPKEPLQYRFQEIIYVYGETMKELIEEKFGQRIMSAIDFTRTIDKQLDPKGDRVVITMNGKFLPYRKW